MEYHSNGASRGDLERVETLEVQKTTTPDAGNKESGALGVSNQVAAAFGPPPEALCE